MRSGKGNDIFDQTTKVALDMTAAINQGEISQSGLEQTTMRLGKALNDPDQRDQRPDSGRGDVH